MLYCLRRLSEHQGTPYMSTVVPHAVEWSTESIMAGTHYVTLRRHRSACRLLALPVDEVLVFSLLLSALQGSLAPWNMGYSSSQKGRRRQCMQYRSRHRYEQPAESSWFWHVTTSMPQSRCSLLGAGILLCK